MIDRTALLSDLQALLKRLEADLLERSESAEVAEVGRTLRAEYDRAREAQRTAQNYEDWRSDAITQAAAAWVLSCVFVRFLEDNRLIDPPRIAGPNERLQRARDELELYIREARAPNERDYLLGIFDELAGTPGTRDVFGEHNPIRQLPAWLSGDAARELLGFFQRIDADTGALVHDFTDPAWDTRFLGDLYQDLSEAARKKYALLQTPEFVEEFILDRTLEPALDEFGLEGFKMIDPACGSGHFLLGAFFRILARWQKQEPSTSTRDLVQQTLHSLHGVDVNPYAAAIARFRLLLAAMQACDATRLAVVPDFRINVACGDSLLHGAGEQQSFGWRDVDHVSYAEDLTELRRILVPSSFHAVVANPPYITPRDSALNNAYRERYTTCYSQFQLVVPFIERLFTLALRASEGVVRPHPAFVGMIVGNAFSKARFGRTLVQDYLRKIELTHVVDTSGAYIPGHGNPDGTPTVILFGRNRAPTTSMVRTVTGLKSEPTPPRELDHGKVWTSITSLLDKPGARDEFVSVEDIPRESFYQHPWSVATDGTARLKEQLEVACGRVLADLIEVPIGRAVRIAQEEIFMFDWCGVRRTGVSIGEFRRFLKGDGIRDWSKRIKTWVWYPYGIDVSQTRFLPHLWPYRTTLSQRVTFQGDMADAGRDWFEYQQHTQSAYDTPLSLPYAFTATHNHFVLDRGGVVFKQTAPVVKCPADTDEDLYVQILSLLNSSVSCFWLRQVSFPRGGYSAGKWEERFNFNSTPMQSLPVPDYLPVRFGGRISALAEELSFPAAVVGSCVKEANDIRTLERRITDAKETYSAIRAKLIALQEELDWECYGLFGLLNEDLTSPRVPPIQLGERAFEIVMARRMAAGELETTWFDRHGSAPMTQIPDKWPGDYRSLIERRISLIENDRDVGLIERPEFKRRWLADSWEAQLEDAFREWLLERLEIYFDFDGRMNEEGRATAKVDVGLISTARLADVARGDAEFMLVGELYRDDPAFDVQRLVDELVADQCVPLLPVLRYKPSGLRKRAEWEKTWALQRIEDTIDARVVRDRELEVRRDWSIHADDGSEPITEHQAKLLKKHHVGEIPVPPKYTSADFLAGPFWRLRGKLDVPKERWVSFPHCEGPDGTPVVAWAGYDHLQLARAVSAYYVDVQERLGGRDDPRLVPLLACLVELLPWLKQWHNEVDPEFGMAMGDYFEGFVAEEARGLGKTIPEIKAWQPPKRAGGRRGTRNQG